MNRLQHPSNNHVLGAPAGWNQNEMPCGALSVTRTHVNGVPCMVSYWTPTADELADLNKGHPIMLYVMGLTMTPVALGVE